MTAGVLLGLAVVLGRPEKGEVEARPSPVPPGAAAVAAPPASPPPAPRAVAPVVPRPAPAVSDEGAALAAALGEEREVLPSGVLIEEIERDREWVCAGESVKLSARLGGEPEPEAVSRWVWLVPGGAELEPGPRLQWQAPEAAGTYRVRFQVGTDLGGRRVGVLAERDVELEVRACGEGEGQAHEPLRLGASQGLRGSFSFQALYQGREAIQEYVWDFGDGATLGTSGPLAEHTYAMGKLGPDESRSVTVKLTVKLERGGTLEARTFVVLHGQPGAAEQPPVALDISRWRPRAKGQGWRSELSLRRPLGSEVTWERLERLRIDWDGRTEVTRRDWRDVIHVEETLARGGFRGYVTVSPSESTAEVKQLVDTLHGRDATGQEVVVSWSPYKGEAPPVPPRPVPEEELPRGKE